MKKTFAILVTLMLGVGGFFYFYTTDSKAQVQVNTLIPINDIELRDLLLKPESEFFVYVGRTTCPFCNAFRPNVEEVISDQYDLIVYYFDTDENRENEFFTEVIDKLNLTSVPFLIYIRNGEVIDLHGFNDGYSMEEIQAWIEKVV